MINEFLKFLKAEKNYSDHTILNYKNDLLKFQNWLDSEKYQIKLEDISRPRVFKNYFAYLELKNTNIKSIVRYNSTLRSFYNFLIMKKIIYLNPLDMVVIPKVPKRLPQALNNNEIEFLFKSINTSKVLGQRNYLILELLYSMGLRVSELINIKLNSISLDNKTILITGKGEKDRFLPIHNSLSDLIRNYITYTRISLLAKGVNIYTDNLLINYKGTPLTARGVRIILNYIIRKSGETYNISPHVLRHSFASTLLANGADLRSIQELLGHASLKSTQVYLSISNADLKKNFDTLHPRNKKDV